MNRLMLILGLVLTTTLASAGGIPVHVGQGDGNGGGEWTGAVIVEVPIPAGATHLNGYTMSWWGLDQTADYVGVRVYHNAGVEHFLDQPLIDPKKEPTGRWSHDWTPPHNVGDLSVAKVWF